MSAAPLIIKLAGCSICGRPMTSLRSRVTCGDEACRWKWKYQQKQRDPRQMRATRDRCRAWAARVRNVKSANPWLRGAPIYASEYLPGGACEIEIKPAPKWPLEHRNIRLLHGALSHLVGETHDRACPAFALVPWARGCGWYAHFWREDVARRLAARAHAARIGQQTCELRLGPLTRVRAPARVTRRGRTKVRIDAITPVVICRDGKSTMYTAPTTQHLGSTLRGTLARRLGLDEIDTSMVRIEMLDRETQPETVMLGSHWGSARGWVGHVTAEVNASGLWLLECAARGLGLGAMTGVGFGRIKLTMVGGDDA